MGRRIDSAAVGRILESVLLLRSARLTGILSRGESPLLPPHSSTAIAGARLEAESAIRSAREYLRDALLDAVEIEASSSAGSSLVVVEDPRLASSKKGVMLTEKTWEPRKEIGSVLEGRDLRQMDLSGARLSASFNRSDLTDAALVGSYFAHCTFNSCVVHNADLSGGQFHSCTFMSTDASRVTARRAHFSHCTFHRADLCDWDACGATFFQCSFTMSDLSRWHVDGQTTVIKPVDWGRCRRLNWTMKPGSGLRECRVVGDVNAMGALSLGPPHRPGCRPWRSGK
ncbi:hypothetical protein ABB37_03646 [Leptomonas pyrrhocoris]|uniref:Pentapeptide repeat-containing protein n=1 Tax=Leptomonas pyrrhocoris TaxID=157538 RepID=A0A0M9G378_LEPPY|nr:hypothetical protein ABB37_03646 [Leptomonas pyrrhocoris]KPA81226.1 hypothetical protein ABB37_03646 [Leptomonas pyrrhocoris]|eukprot:XP_015659665.1 hypothetical protein ABB37_03646 [Leptomonas pyrrhocoris]